MELLQIIESSVFLFSLFGLFLLIISFISYRFKRNNNKLILQPVRQNHSISTQSSSQRISTVENLKFENVNSLKSNKFIVLNENPTVKKNFQEMIYHDNITSNYSKTAEFDRLRPAKFYSLDELK